MSTRTQIMRDMAWTHHWADQHDRCANVGGRLVCRRCLVLYPVTAVVLLFSRAGLHWPMSLDGIALFSLPLPLVVDFAAEHMGFTKYSARRQIVTTFLGAVSLGHAFDRYLNHNGDPLFWTMVGSYAGLCAGAVAVHHLRERRAVQQQDLINEANDPLVRGFASRAEMLAYLER